MRKFERSKSMKREFQWNLQGQWHISCESTIFQFKTEADFRLGFPSRKKEFDQGSKESHPFMFFAIFLTSICGAKTFQLDISFFRIQFWGRSLVLTRLVKQKTSWVGRNLLSWTLRQYIASSHLPLKHLKALTWYNLHGQVFASIDFFAIDTTSSSYHIGIL